MSRRHLVVGIDPGPTPGVCLVLAGAPLFVDVEFIAYHYKGDLAELPRHLFEAVATCGPDYVAVGCEHYVVSRTTTRGRHRAAQRATMDAEAKVEQWAKAQQLPYLARNAEAIKEWATDTRLEAADWLRRTKGLRHARDASRVALWTAVKVGWLPDPLDK